MPNVSTREIVADELLRSISPSAINNSTILSAIVKAHADHPPFRGAFGGYVYGTWDILVSAFNAFKPSKARSVEPASQSAVAAQAPLVSPKPKQGNISHQATYASGATAARQKLHQLQMRQKPPVLNPPRLSQ